MKAKVKKTGEIIEIEPYERLNCVVSAYKGGNGLLYPAFELEFEKDIDWEQRRYEFAKTALNGMLAHSTRYRPRECDNGLHWHEAISREAIEIANEMIKQLKGE